MKQSSASTAASCDMDSDSSNSTISGMLNPKSLCIVYTMHPKSSCVILNYNILFDIIGKCMSDHNIYAAYQILLH